jgi:hypothetical protein
MGKIPFFVKVKGDLVIKMVQSYDCGSFPSLRYAPFRLLFAILRRNFLIHRATPDNGNEKAEPQS